MKEFIRHKVLFSFFNYISYFSTKEVREIDETAGKTPVLDAVTHHIVASCFTMGRQNYGLYCRYKNDFKSHHGHFGISEYQRGT